MDEIGYGYQSFECLTISTILESYSQQEIIKIVFGEYPDFEKKYNSPFRKDTNAGCFFETDQNGMILFVDWADNMVNRDCVQLIKEKYNLGLLDALQFILDYFTNPNIKIEIKPDLTLKTYNTLVTVKEHYPILYKPSKFQKKDISYWNQFGITPEQLTEDKVIPISGYKFYSHKKRQFFHVMCEKEPAYIYTEFKNQHRKVYKPTQHKTEKWLTDCNKNDIYNYNNIPLTGKKLTITKSYKDCRVIRNYFYTSIAFQNEGQFPDEWFFKDIIYRYEEIIIFFDNDEAGKKSAYKLQEVFLTYGKYVKVVFSTFQEKDPSDIYKIHGPKILKQFLIEHLGKN